MRFDRSLFLHLGVIGLLLALHFVLPAYHHANLARIMVLAVFAMGYNITFGYTGMLSLGHALFFGAGLYGTGLVMVHLDWPAWAGLIAGLAAAGLLALVIGTLALRTTGVAFMIVTLMFAQVGFLTVLYFNDYTRGDEGFVIPQAVRAIGSVDFSDETTRYLLALALFSAAILVQLALVRSATGRVFVAMRENEERSRLLGYGPFRYKLTALIISGLFAGAAGAFYAVLFGYAGATFVSIQYSILPLLWVLLGGAGTILGPFLGTLFMFYLIDISGSYTSAHHLVVGVALLLLVLWAPKGILGAVRERWAQWLP